MTTPSETFHPAVAAWFGRRFPAGPTGPQARAWPAIREGRATLVAAPTGSGKTLAAFLAAIDGLVRQAVAGRLDDATQVVYVSPLKALSNDIQRNLQEPLAGIAAELKAMGLDRLPEIRTMVRTGDTPAKERAAMLRRPPHILVTTPESLYILLTSERGRGMLRTTRTVIVDEIHALVDDKRGSHLALSLERLEALAARSRTAGDGSPAPRLIRIGCSATQRPIEDAARFLVGAGGLDPDGAPRCAIIDTGHARDLDLRIEVPRSPLQAVMPNEVWEEVYDRLAALIGEHRTTLIFVNTRRLAERLSRQLSDRIGGDAVTAHHGSLSRAHRLAAEQRLKSGELRALVATASLELGIDIGSIDLVCQIGSTRSIATLLQRAGRSGHSVGGFPKGRLFPLTRDELVESAALLDSVRRGELDRFAIPEAPLDILAQQIVAMVACEEWSDHDLYALVRGAFPYRALPRADFDAVVTMLAEGFSVKRGRRAAHLHHDRVNGRLRARKGARLTAITSGGAIPDSADYQVVLEPEGTLVGTVNEDFAIESMAGEIFQLGNASWKILRIEPGKVRVEDARGQPPGIPFWIGEAPARTAELSLSVSRLREEIAGALESGDAGTAVRHLMDGVGLSLEAAEQIVDYLAAARAALGVLPSQSNIVLERFFDESGGMQLVLHSPFGRRINFAWGLALRKRFCRKFNIELQAAATEDAIVLSLGPSHSFPLEDVFRYLRAGSVRDVLVQALLAAPMFAVRWRWNAARSLAIPRFRGGRRVAPQLQRMQAEDLIAAVFPDQIACAENLTGERQIPDHPLVRQTIDDCLGEAMDLPGLESLLASIERGERTLLAKDVREPSPLAQEVLSARPYAFLDDAPLEERRTQAVVSRRWTDPQTASDLGALDAAAIDRVRDEAWPRVESADELADALEILGFVGESEGRDSGWEGHLRELVAERRATVFRLPGRGPRLWVAASRLSHVLAAFPSGALDPPIPALPGDSAGDPIDAMAALAEIVRGRLEGLGPVTAQALAGSCGFPDDTIEQALLRLESEGFVLRGRFTPGIGAVEWCARSLLARIHRYTLNRLRAEIEPVSAADFMRFLFSWQRVLPDDRAEGAQSLQTIVEMLEGFEAPAAAWERDILPARLSRYDPAWLDALCLSGRVVWARLSPPRPAPDSPPGAGPVRSTPIALLSRGRLSAWRALTLRPDGGREPSTEAGVVLDLLAARGALFFDEIAERSGLLPTRVENALAELVARGTVTSDGFTGLRALITPSGRRGSRRRRSPSPFGMESAGRWTVLWNDRTVAESEDSPAETIAPVLLRRYGIVFRRLLEREGAMPPWRDLLRVLRRMEGRGEVRGGRFVAGVSGEQFARPEAVERLRAVRRAGPSGSLLPIGSADPLNLVGLLLPGPRIAPTGAGRILYRDGVPIAVREAGEVRPLVDLDEASAWRARDVLVKRGAPPLLRPSLGHTA
ncbi:MAG TPA: DEAD/DEAH box helicase [Candidatus Dormibacteraeota bacterium]|nr:DEAD/DEAH box helicase [Candidatus Dormibacteraeota bacterium]